MRTALFFILLVVLGGAVGCCPCREVRTAEAVFNYDTTKVVHVDTTHVIIRDTTTLQRLLQSRDRVVGVRESHLENDYCTSDAVVNGDGSLTHTLDTKDSAMLPARVVEVERIVCDTIFRDRVEYVERVITKQVKKPLSKLVKAHIIGFWVMAVGIFIRHRKKIIRVFAGWRN